MNKVLVVVDMQNDFITGALGSADAVSIVPNVANKIKEYIDNKNFIFFTLDTHSINYFDTLEGIKLPVKHCDYSSHGWLLCTEIDRVIASHALKEFVKKDTFGSLKLVLKMQKLISDESEIEIVGLVTDICVVSNALILRSFFPNNKITVDASCCAGTSKSAHIASLKVMQSCMIEIGNLTDINNL